MRNNAHILILAVLVGCGKFHSARPSNFGFICEYGIFPGNTLNTFDGTLTNKVMITGDSIATVKIRLSNQQLDSIYAKMIDIDVFNYPNRFSPDTSRAIALPSPIYIIRIKAGEVEKEIHWISGFQSNKKEAKQLDELFDLIQKMVARDPNYAKLPKAIYM